MSSATKRLLSKLQKRTPKSKPKYEQQLLATRSEPMTPVQVLTTTKGKEYAIPMTKYEKAGFIISVIMFILAMYVYISDLSKKHEQRSDEKVVAFVRFFGTILIFLLQLKARFDRRKRLIHSLNSRHISNESARSRESSSSSE